MYKKILIAENFKFINDSIVSLISKSFDEITFATAHTYTDLLFHLSKRSTLPDMVILSLDLPDMKSLVSIKKILDTAKEVQILIRINDNIPISYIVELINLGISGVFSLSTNTNSLPYIIKIIMTGEKYIPYDLVPLLLKHPENERKKYSLSKREHTIFTLMSIGISNKEIANYTGIQCSTVKVHNKSIFKKLNVNTRNEATKKYFAVAAIASMSTNTATSLNYSAINV
ncbi:response regulator transcription factor [Amylibacter sp. SFDW26]|uniref:LuxR C-terminal-related transcriptional regulator n=1 Tax=Amylibacter sp. SFDW26 TaxID=2652722 RepID=UPI00126234AF|nr:response regulator transcription factor [Amylibacter sp. SFDW26]KAB7610274.1 response regulator transcription factor [Amylibacter sp. SFDW26]